MMHVHIVCTTPTRQISGQFKFQVNVIMKLPFAMVSIKFILCNFVNVNFFFSMSRIVFLQQTGTVLLFP